MIEEPNSHPGDPTIAWLSAVLGWKLLCMCTIRDALIVTHPIWIPVDDFCVFQADSLNCGFWIDFSDLNYVRISDFFLTLKASKLPSKNIALHF